MKKVKAYTISELLIVMAITGIMVTAAFYTLNAVQKQFLNLQKSLELEQKVMLLEKKLTVDFHKATLMLNKNRDRLSLNYGHREKEYVMNAKGIFEKTDSLFVPIQKATFYYKGKEVGYGLVDAIELEFTNIFSSRTLFVSQKNDAAYYMNNTWDFN